MLIRPVEQKDLSDIMDLVSQSGFGLTNLPKDRDLIARRIAESLDLLTDNQPGTAAETACLLVMEDIESRRVIGTGGIKPRVGVGEPFYAYRIDTHVKDSPALKIHKELECLHLLTICDGPAEIGVLFVHPAFQKHGLGRLMSLSRFVFMAEHSHLFAATVIAEMRGVSDNRGRSSFWDGLGRHFFAMDFPKADYLSSRNKTFIAELMPRHPIYTVLLPEPAQAVIGQVHDQTRPALKLLQQEGFEYTGMVDIFDGGPIVRCNRDRIRTIRESRTGVFTHVLPAGADAADWLIATGRLREFRACLGRVSVEGDGRVRLSAPAVDLLRLSPGDHVRFAPLRATAPAAEGNQP